MLTPLSVNTLCVEDKDQLIRMNEQRTGYGQSKNGAQNSKVRVDRYSPARFKAIDPVV